MTTQNGSSKIAASLTAAEKQPIDILQSAVSRNSSRIEMLKSGLEKSGIQSAITVEREFSKLHKSVERAAVSVLFSADEQTVIRSRYNDLLKAIF